ncbi:hypothetical protein B0H14DRAFT_2555121 [Mycena olivaceomarginata]|nr:hypothetical protein B0H14DRAFT_2555121 [Mycena olivaceomarginata]
MLGEMLDWVSIEKNKLVDYEAYMLGHECTQNEQIFTPYAHERRPVFCAALTAEYLKNRTKISAFTDVHVQVLAFTHRAIVLNTPDFVLFCIPSELTDIILSLTNGLLDTADTYLENSHEDPSEIWVVNSAHTDVKTDQVSTISHNNHGRTI